MLIMYNFCFSSHSWCILVSSFTAILYIFPIFSLCRSSQWSQFCITLTFCLVSCTSIQFHGTSSWRYQQFHHFSLRRPLECFLHSSRLDHYISCRILIVFSPAIFQLPVAPWCFSTKADNAQPLSHLISMIKSQKLPWEHQRVSVLHSTRGWNTIPNLSPG